MRVLDVTKAKHPLAADSHCGSFGGNPLDIRRFARQGLGMIALLLHMHEGVEIKDAFIDTDRARYDRPHFTAS